MISGVQKISIYDPATGIVVQLNNVVPDGEALIASPLYYKDIDGKLKYDGDKSYLSFGAYDDGGFAQLASWMKAKTPVRVVTAGFEENLLWYESAPILVKKDYSYAVGNKNYFSVEIAKEGGTHNIKSVANLILGPGLWYDANTNGIADSLIKTGTYTTSFNNSSFIQTLTFISGQTGSMSCKIEFPISGINIHHKFVEGAGSNLALYVPRLHFMNYASGIISSINAAETDAVSPSSTYYFIQEIDVPIAPATTESLLYGIPYLGQKRNSYTNIKY
ncbi:MAG: hypothetical protein WA138_16050 [Parvibaculum sp.]